MAEISLWAEHRQEIFDRETTLGRSVAHGLDSAQTPGYIFRRGEVLVDSSTADELSRLSQDRGFTKKSDLHQLGVDLQRWAIPENAEPAEVLTALKNRKKSIVADINHVYSGEYAYRGGPADAPRARGPLPLPPGTLRGEPDIAVLDTGVFLPKHRLVEQVEDIGSAEQTVDRLDEDRNRLLDSQAGHGTFICGIIRQHQPQVRIEQRRVLDAEGFGSDYTVAKGLASIRARVVNLSLGTYTRNDEPPTAVSRAIEFLQNAGHIVVAAAGNNASDRPFWPAAFAKVIGVAAITANGDRTGFSNYGPWVNVSAPGVNISSCYVEHFEDEPLTGWAQWSGTSFAAPVVAAQLAARVKAGLSPKTAVAQFLAELDPAGEPGLGRAFLPESRVTFGATA